MNSEERFRQAVTALSPPIAALLEKAPLMLRLHAQEVRLRVGRPLALFDGRAHIFLDGEGRPAAPEQGYRISRQELAACFRSLCGYSIHSHQGQLNEGYVTVQGGHRAGICATAVYEDGVLQAMRDVSSINLRIAREVRGIADELLVRQLGGQLYSTLLAGPPASGKTTLLREMARQYASGLTGRCYKVTVIDERGEIAAVSGGVPQNDLGWCTDVLDGVDKPTGILMATRALSPQLLVVDELGTLREVEAMLEGVNSGVKLLVTVHAADRAQLLRKTQVQRLLQAGVLERILLLCADGPPGRVAEMIDPQTLVERNG